MRSGGKGDAIPLLKFFEMPRPVGGVIHSYSVKVVPIDNKYKSVPQFVGQAHRMRVERRTARTAHFGFMQIAHNFLYC
jgi:hypothetical protein